MKPTYPEAVVSVYEAGGTGFSVAQHQVLQFAGLRQTLLLNHQFTSLLVHHTVLGWVCVCVCVCVCVGGGGGGGKGGGSEGGREGEK